MQAVTWKEIMEGNLKRKALQRDTLKMFCTDLL